MKLNNSCIKWIGVGSGLVGWTSGHGHGPGGSWFESCSFLGEETLEVCIRKGIWHKPSAKSMCMQVWSGQAHSAVATLDVKCWKDNNLWEDYFILLTFSQMFKMDEKTHILGGPWKICKFPAFTLSIKTSQGEIITPHCAAIVHQTRSVSFEKGSAVLLVLSQIWF